MKAQPAGFIDCGFLQFATDAAAAELRRHVERGFGCVAIGRPVRPGRNTGPTLVIRDLVDKRHGFVHRGAMDSIVGDDLQASDDLLFNVFTNIVKHPKLFPSKDALADFSDDVKAAKRLGGRTRIRPKTMKIWRASRPSEAQG